MITYYYVTPKSFDAKLKALIELGGFTKDNPAITHVERIASRTIAIAERNTANAQASQLVYVYPEGHQANDAMYAEADIVMVKDGPSLRIVKAASQIDDTLFELVPPSVAQALEDAA